ncbi:MAG: DNA polymerase IV [Puniceicoccales bacterium]|jgi:DNA polymerase-4|nr:DNA polymerase IV [Puniceicoccales bacterium]
MGLAGDSVAEQTAWRAKGRKIIHVDMDAFFAAVEQRDRPKLRGRPVIVGGSPWNRGVVSTCSYEARSYGVHSAMASRTALELCPHAVFLPVRMERYGEVSRHFFAFLRQITDLVEPLSLDEAFLDVTENRLREASATRLAEHIQKTVRCKFGLSCSVGVSYNCFLAKMASKRKKPAGRTVIGPEEALDFLAALPIGEFFGIGPATAQKLRARQIFTGADLRALSLKNLEEMLGKMGRRYYAIVRGVDPRPVNPVHSRKSLSRERTFDEDLKNIDELSAALRELAEEVAAALRRENIRGRTITLKLRYGNFESITRSRTFSALASDGFAIASAANELLRERTSAWTRSVRLIGVAVSSFAGGTPNGDRAFFQPELPLVHCQRQEFPEVDKSF